MKERFLIVIVAIIAGLFITSAGFFIYQSTKRGNDTPIAKKTTTTIPTQADQPPGSFYIKVIEPTDESLTDKRTLDIKGTTNPDNLVIISTNLQDVEVKPNQNGDFSTTIDIDAGANEVITRAVAANGDSVQDIKTVTYSTDDF